MIFIGLIILLILVIIYLEPLLFKNVLKTNDELGSAKFANYKEISDNFIRCEISNIDKVGVPVYFDKFLKYVWFDFKTPHYVYLGSTGSGKSVTSVIPMCSFIASAKNKRSVFITDPKGEIYGATSKMFKDNEYDIITLDFRNSKYSNRYNLLEPIIKEYELYMNYERLSEMAISDDERYSLSNKAITHLSESERLTEVVASLIMVDDKTVKDPFWNNSSKNLLSGLISYYMEEYKVGNIKREQITLTSISKFQNSISKKNNLELFKRLIDKKEYGQKSKDLLIPVLNASEATYKSITATFGEKMSIFNNTKVAHILSSCDFNLTDLGNKPTVFYMIVPDEDKIYYKLVTITVGLLYKELVKEANNNEDKKLKIEIDWILDEFANCPPMNEIETMVSVARSRGMRFHFYIQSFSQLSNIYGKDVSQIILDNCGLVFLKTNTQETAETISKMLGKKTIKVKGTTVNNSQKNLSHSMSESLQARDLMTAEEIMKLQYKTIIFPVVGNPIFRNTIMYDKFDCYVKGKVKRDERKNKKLNSTYFTIENHPNYSLNVSGRNNKEEILEVYAEGLKIEKESLKYYMELLKPIVKDTCEMSIKDTEDYRAYILIESKNKIKNIIHTKIKRKLDSNTFNIITKNNTIEIYVNGPARNLIPSEAKEN